MTSSDLKKHIRDWLKQQNSINSPLGLVEIQKGLGEGGNALVFERPFAGGTAIKFLAEAVTDSPSKRYLRFLNEYRNLVKLVSTGVIVSLHQYGLQDMGGTSVPYIIMERCLGTLADICGKEKITTKEQFKSIFEQLLYSISVIHSVGIIHRDIKPQNILQRESGQLILGDFGIAWFDPNLYDEKVLTEKSERLANFEFSAPEQVRRSAYERPTPSMTNTILVHHRPYNKRARLYPITRFLR